MNKIRKLTHDGIDYFWSVKDFLYEGSLLKIWRGNKNDLIFKGETKEKEVTPSVVLEIIKKS